VTDFLCHPGRDCTAPAKEKSCYRCGETGHISRDCQQPSENSNSGGGYSGSRGPRESGSGGGSGAECYKCGKVGHIARNCNSNSGGDSRGGYRGGDRGDRGDRGGYQSGGGSGGQTCYSCGGYGMNLFASGSKAYDANEACDRSHVTRLHTRPKVLQL